MKMWQEVSPRNRKGLIIGILYAMQSEDIRREWHCPKHHLVKRIG